MHARHAAHVVMWALGVALLAATPAPAIDYLDESRTITDGPQSTTEHFTFTLEEDSPAPRFDLAITMTQGRAELRILDPAGRVRQHMGAQRFTGRDRPIVGGKTKVHLGSGLTSASLMILVAVAFVWFWRRRGVPWRWFWAGAGLWLAAVAVKFAIAIPLNRVIFQGLKTSLPHWAYLTTGAAYGGIMTGVTEILFVMIAALIWPRMAATADRAVAIGVGAGAFEAILLGLGAAAMAVSGSLSPATPAGTYAVEVTTTEAVGEWHLHIHDGPALSTSSQEKAPFAAWTRALTGPTERLLAILCHVASRVLVLLAVARRRWYLFWCGFALLSGVDALATLFWITGQVGTRSPWLMEALFAPFALVSIPITVGCVRRWPGVPQVRTPEGAEAEPSPVARAAGGGQGQE